MSYTVEPRTTVITGVNISLPVEDTLELLSALRAHRNERRKAGFGEWKWLNTFISAIELTSNL